jgi:hypothetical protein
VVLDHLSSAHLEGRTNIVPLECQQSYNFNSENDNPTPRKPPKDAHPYLGHNATEGEMLRYVVKALDQLKDDAANKSIIREIEV